MPRCNTHHTNTMQLTLYKPKSKEHTQSSSVSTSMLMSTLASNKSCISPSDVGSKPLFPPVAPFRRAFTLAQVVLTTVTPWSSQSWISRSLWGSERKSLNISFPSAAAVKSTPLSHWIALGKRCHLSCASKNASSDHFCAAHCACQQRLLRRDLEAAASPLHYQFHLTAWLSSASLSGMPLLE